MLIEYPGKNVMVVGAARGIGKGIATAFAETGANVYACDLLLDEVKAYAGPCGKGDITALYADVTSEDSVNNVVRTVSASTGIDVLVYVAGGVAGQVHAPIETISLAAWQAVMDVNLTGAFLFVRALVPIMKKAKKGRIITISSGAGLGTSLTGIQAYCTAKHGQNGLVMQLGRELAPHNITINAIASGFMKTNPEATAQWDGYTPEFQKAFLAKLAGGRIGRPDDIANTAMFLASDHAEWITGQIIPVMGGPL